MSRASAFADHFVVPARADLLLPVQEVAAMLDVSPRTLQAWRAQRDATDWNTFRVDRCRPGRTLPYVREGRDIYYRELDVVQFAVDQVLWGMANRRFAR